IRSNIIYLLVFVFTPHGAPVPGVPKTICVLPCFTLDYLSFVENVWNGQGDLVHIVYLRCIQRRREYAISRRSDSKINELAIASVDLSKESLYNSGISV